MASYYMSMGGISPSRRLTDLLSAYLDFDDSSSSNDGAENPLSSGGADKAKAGGGSRGGGGRRQLNLGLWGGDLTLHDVALRRDAIEPLLNELLMNGGGGGDLYLVGSPHHNTLHNFNNKVHFRAGRGGHGGQTEVRFPLSRE